MSNDSLLTKVFTTFTGIMIKSRLEWEKNKRALIAVIPVALLIGILIGWFILGWGLFPVRWENVSPAWLRADYKSAYLAAVADDYEAGALDDLAVKQRLGLDLRKSRTLPWTQDGVLLEDLDTAIDMAQEPGDPYKLSAQLVALKKLQNNVPSIMEAEAPAAEQPETEKKGLDIQTLGILLAVLLLISAALYFVWYMIVGRERKAAEVEEIGYREDMEGGISPGAALNVEALGQETALEPFNTPYTFGDDYFDPSFSIEIGKNFLGECGIGISETINAGDPKKVTAFEAWLFDKSDIRTITNVMASPYAIRTPGIKDKLDPKGEIIPLEAGQQIVLETTVLRVVVTIKDLEYAPASVDVEPESVFQKVNFELQAWVKPVPMEFDTDTAG